MKWPGIQPALWYAAARVAAWRRPRATAQALPAGPNLAPQGISVVIPSRNGRALLAAQMPGIMRELAGMAAQVIVVDNGSDDGTAEWLHSEYPAVDLDVSPEPLSFAAAVNRGIARALHSHVCLLNNDMLLDAGFFTALWQAFQRVPGLFCATAQILFPAGVRREETGKAVMAQTHPDDFPVRCDLPLAGEDLTYVPYGSGGCSLYDASMLQALGGVDEAYAPAYVEDLDLGYRAWQRGWPTVFVADAQVEHRHRATTSRYYSEPQLAEILEVNYLKFLARAVADGRLFRKLWRQALDRLLRRQDTSLRHAATLARAPRPAIQADYPEADFLALTSGDVAVFPGRHATRGPLLREVETMEAPPEQLLEEYCEVVQVREGNQVAWRAAHHWTAIKWAGRSVSKAPRLP